MRYDPEIETRSAAKQAETRAFNSGQDIDFVEKRRIVYASVRSFVLIPDFENPSCASTDPEIFFAKKGEWVATHEAKKVCRSCPVLERCRDFALDNNISHGVWGGMSARERWDMRRLMSHG